MHQTPAPGRSRSRNRVSTQLAVPLKLPSFLIGRKGGTEGDGAVGAATLYGISRRAADRVLSVCPVAQIRLKAGKRDGLRSRSASAASQTRSGPLRVLGRPGGLRNSRTALVLAHCIYAYRPWQWRHRCGSTMLARNPGPACAPRMPPTGPKTTRSQPSRWERPVGLAVRIGRSTITLS
jgi:hypothetical protein